MIIILYHFTSSLKHWNYSQLPKIGATWKWVLSLTLDQAPISTELRNLLTTTNDIWLSVVSNKEQAVAVLNHTPYGYQPLNPVQSCSRWISNEVFILFNWGLHWNLDPLCVRFKRQCLPLTIVLKRLKCTNSCIGVKWSNQNSQISLLILLGYLTGKQHDTSNTCNVGNIKG